MATATGTYATRTAVKTRLGGTFTTAEDSLIDTICDGVNQEIETLVGRVLAPIASAAYLFDGDGRRSIWVPMGIRAISLLEIADGTGETFTTIAAGDYFLRPLAQDRKPTWPATRILLSDSPAGDYACFPAGLANVRVTMTAGWDAIPDDATRIGVDAAIRAWHARQIGQSEGMDQSGGTSNYLATLERQILHAYAAESPVTA